MVCSVSEAHLPFAALGADLFSSALDLAVPLYFVKNVDAPP